ncbi:hypothetical protein C0J52_26772 [Blattella germanica]|nr:hypothetical protein C0J52_26772 [Blattella germanica]
MQNPETICRPIKGNPQKLIRQAARELGMKRSTVHKVLRHRLRLYAYKVQIVLCICIPPHNLVYVRSVKDCHCHYSPPQKEALAAAAATSFIVLLFLFHPNA